MWWGGGEREPPHAASRANPLRACWWMGSERDRQAVRLRREGHLRDMAGVPKGTLATSPPDEHVARGTFRTLTVARGTFATSLSGRARREGHLRDIAAVARGTFRTCAALIRS